MYSKAYGLTESMAGHVQDLNDPMLESCGKPMPGMESRLVNWEKGKYRVTDKPNPRGEIILGGDSIVKVVVNENYDVVLELTITIIRLLDIFQKYGCLYTFHFRVI